MQPLVWCNITVDACLQYQPITFEDVVPSFRWMSDPARRLLPPRNRSQNQLDTSTLTMLLMLTLLDSYVVTGEKYCGKAAWVGTTKDVVGKTGVCISVRARPARLDSMPLRTVKKRSETHILRQMARLPMIS